jgi:hypothetical protein
MQAAGLGSPDCNFCESGALTYSTFAECYAAEAAFIPQVCPAGQPWQRFEPLACLYGMDCTAGCKCTAVCRSTACSVARCTLCNVCLQPNWVWQKSCSFPIRPPFICDAYCVLVFQWSQGPSIQTASYPVLSEGRVQAVEAFALVDDFATLSAQAAAAASVTTNSTDSSTSLTTPPAAVVTEAGAAASTTNTQAALPGPAAALQPVALLGTGPEASTGAAAAAAGQVGSRRMLGQPQRRHLLQACPLVNPCLVSFQSIYWLRHKAVCWLVVGGSLHSSSCNMYAALVVTRVVLPSALTTLCNVLVLQCHEQCMHNPARPSLGSRPVLPCVLVWSPAGHLNYVALGGAVPQHHSHNRCDHPCRHTCGPAWLCTGQQHSQRAQHHSAPGSNGE